MLDWVTGSVGAVAERKHYEHNGFCNNGRQNVAVFFWVVGGDPNAGMRQKNIFSRRFCFVKNFLTRIGPTAGRPQVDRKPTAVPLSPKSESLADTKSRYQTINIKNGKWVDGP